MSLRICVCAFFWMWGFSGNAKTSVWPFSIRHDEYQARKTSETERVSDADKKGNASTFVLVWSPYCCVLYCVLQTPTKATRNIRGYQQGSSLFPSLSPAYGNQCLCTVDYTKLELIPCGSFRTRTLRVLRQIQSCDNSTVIIQCS